MSNVQRKKFLGAFDLKWFLETEDQGRIPDTTLERRFCKSRACKQDTSTFMKPKAACYKVEQLTSIKNITT